MYFCGSEIVYYITRKLFRNNEICDKNVWTNGRMAVLNVPAFAKYASIAVYVVQGGIRTKIRGRAQ
jgi:hypothetical protein